MNTYNNIVNWKTHRSERGLSFFPGLNIPLPKLQYSLFTKKYHICTNVSVALCSTYIIDYFFNFLFWWYICLWANYLCIYLSKSVGNHGLLHLLGTPYLRKTWYGYSLIKSLAKPLSNSKEIVLFHLFQWPPDGWHLAKLFLDLKWN